MKQSGSKSAMTLGRRIWVRKWLDPDLNKSGSNMMHYICQIDRRASRESTPEPKGHAIGSAIVKRERISRHRTCIWIDTRRARARLSTSKGNWIDGRRTKAHLAAQETHSDRRVSSESASGHMGNAFGSACVERERLEGFINSSS